MVDSRGICIVTFPYSISGVIPSSNLVNIIKEIYDEVFIICPEVFKTNYDNEDHINIYSVNSEWKGSKFNRVITYFNIQIKTAWMILKLRNNFDKCIFFIGGELFIFPIIICKILNIKSILYFAGSLIETSAQNQNIKKFTSYIRILSALCTYFSNIIILYSVNLIQEWNLEKYKNKIVICSEHFLRFDKFNIQNEIYERELIGYIGRLNEEKGVMNFVESIPSILKEEDLKFIIIGDGILKVKIKDFIKKNNLEKNVELKNWIKHEELPYYLNKIRLLVIPSYTEGLPNIMIEAMACGTPVLATNVGAISDILKDNETGFVLSENSKECIKITILKVLKDSKERKITQNAFNLVREQFTYKNVVKRWKSILSE